MANDDQNQEINVRNHLSPYGAVSRAIYGPFLARNLTDKTFGRVFGVPAYDKEFFKRYATDQVNALRSKWEDQKADDIQRRKEANVDLSFLNDPKLYETPTDSGSSGAAAALQSMLSAIQDSYARQSQALTANKANAMAGINSAYDTFKANAGRNYADYQNASTQSQQAMAQRVADQLASVQARQNELANAAASMGQNASAIQAQNAGNIDTLKASQSIQDALSSRIAQIVANNQRATENTGDLVKSGATGTLENNYAAMLNALQAQQEQALMQAVAAASGGGRSSGSGSSGGLKDQKLALEVAKLQRDLTGPTSWEDALRSMKTVDLMTLLGGMDPAQQQSTIESIFPGPEPTGPWMTSGRTSSGGRASATGSRR